MIESRYSIEYVNPDSTEEPDTKKIFALFAFLGLTVIAILIYAFFSITQLNDFVRVSSELQSQKLEVANDNGKASTILDVNDEATSDNSTQTIQYDINKLLIEEKQQTSKQTKQLKINEKLNQSINDLTKKLMAEREKNKTLDKKLNSQKNANNQLSELLENALSKASTADRNYLNALNTLEATNFNNRNISIKTDKKIEPNTQTIVRNIEGSESTNSFNAVSLSTNSQVDAIIAAMQGTIKSASKVIKTNVDKTNEIQLAAINKTNSTELLHIQLQRQIDQIILTKNTKNSTNPKIKTVYKAALEKESNIRKNAVRSITIKKGETLWSIAQRAYGSGALYKKIIIANPQTNLKKLFVGQVIRVPK